MSIDIQSVTSKGSNLVFVGIDKDGNTIVGTLPKRLVGKGGKIKWS